MRKRRLKDWVIPSLALIVLFGATFCYYLISNLISYNVTNDLSNIVESKEETVEVNDEVQEVQEEQIEQKAINPYTSEKVIVNKGYYNREDTEEVQENSLIKYENIYMPNTGIMYSSDESFDVISIYDGKVTNIKEDNIMGNIIEIENDNNIVIVYESLSKVNVAVGDTIKQGDVIGISGTNKVETNSENCLHLEVYKDGQIINPNTIFNA